jgi:ABC-type transport system involved in multi-copper enzyme maturation permease subunit
MTIWNIFKKDWLLMRKQALAVGCIQLAFTALQVRRTLIGDEPVIGQLSQVLLWLWLLAGVVLTITVVHQDALPSTSQDWLTRPIPRAALLTEKVLFCLLTIQSASFFSDVVQGVFCGFQFRLIVSAAIARAVVLFIAVILPAIAVGAITKSIMEATVLVASVAFGIFAFTMIAIGLAGGYGNQFDPTDFTGEGWLTNLARSLLLLFGLGVALVWQYRNRKTRQTRFCMAIVIAIVLVSQFIPWTPVFALQKALSPEPNASHGISLALRGPEDPAPDNSRNATRDSLSNGKTVRLVFRDLPAKTLLQIDKLQWTLRSTGGKEFYSAAGGGVGLRNTKSVAATVALDQVLELPAQILRQAEGQKTNVGIVYSLTLFKLGAEYSMPALDHVSRLPEWGFCKTGVSTENTAIEVECVQMGKGPTCGTVFLENQQNGFRNPENTSCYPNYAPYSDRPIPDALSRFRLILPFQDTSGLVKYPVDATQLKRARVVIQMYVPQDHFTRTISTNLRG